MFPRVRNSRRGVMVALTGLLCAIAATASFRALADANAVWGEVVRAPAPEHVVVSMTQEPPALDAALAARQMRALRPYETPVPVGTSAVSRPDSVADPRRVTVVRGLPGDVQAKAAGTFTLFRNVSFGATFQSHTTSTYAVPTVANSGTIVVGTGNWWAAVSSDGGQTFSYINPATQFPSVWGGFSGYQVVLYVPSRDIFIWYLRYDGSGPVGSGQNAYRLAIARPTDALRGAWYFYTFSSAVNTEWDLADVCVSNDYLYLTPNRTVYGGSVDNAFLIRMPLDEIAAEQGFSYLNFDLANRGLANRGLYCARGATSTAYFGSHNSTSQVRIFRMAESAGSFTYDDVNLSAAWPSATKTCVTPDGKDWCAYGDSRIQAGGSAVG